MVPAPGITRGGRPSSRSTLPLAGPASSRSTRRASAGRRRGPPGASTPRPGRRSAGRGRRVRGPVGAPGNRPLPSRQSWVPTRDWRATRVPGPPGRRTRRGHPGTSRTWSGGGGLTDGRGLGPGERERIWRERRAWRWRQACY